MSENASNGVLKERNTLIQAVNQQGRASSVIQRRGQLPSETTRRQPLFQKVMKAYLQGALHDGTFSSNRRFRISQKGTEWLEMLRNFLLCLGYHSWIYQEGKTRDVYVLETLAYFLDFKLKPLALESIEEQKSYIRGFFDAEGGIPHDCSARFYIQLVQKDKLKIVALKEILHELGIQCGKIHNPSKWVDPDYWRVFILAQSQQRFIRKIGSWHPRKKPLLEQRIVI